MWKIEIVILGSGNAFGDGGDHHSAHLIKYTKLDSMLLDCGPSFLVTAKKNNVNLRNIKFLLISHLHGDHFLGIPFLLLHYKYIEPRTSPLQICGPPGLKERIKKLIQLSYTSLYESTLNLFQVTEIELNQEIELEDQIKIKPFLSDHMENSFFYHVKFLLQNFSLAYSGDNRFHIDQLKYFDKVNLLIHECSFKELDAGGHTSWNMLKESLDKILEKVEKLVLVHLSTEVRKIPNSDFPEKVIRAQDGTRIQF